MLNYYILYYIVYFVFYIYIFLKYILDIYRSMQIVNKTVSIALFQLVKTIGTMQLTQFCIKYSSNSDLQLQITNEAGQCSLLQFCTLFIFSNCKSVQNKLHKYSYLVIMNNYEYLCNFLLHLLVATEIRIWFTNF